MKYEDPLITRYSDEKLVYLFSEEYKSIKWRECWIALAESQFELGLKQINQEMIDEMKENKENIDFNIIKEKEKEIRHEVMAHIYEYGLKCPKAKGIIHLGATSQFVICNSDLIIIKEALKIIKNQLLNLIKNLHDFCDKTKGLVTLSYTHFQPAQPTTMGKRFSLYLQDILFDLNEIEKIENLIKARGTKGTTGTQASFLDLFEDQEKVKQLDLLVSQKLGFDCSYTITSQTYPRKIDSLLFKVLSGIAESSHKFSVDLRLASNLKILEEPFETNQTGSSAMPYKRNPIRSERITSLSRKLISMQLNASNTFANQWFERTLDDSAIRRMDIPQAFLLTNAILKLYNNIANGLVVNEHIINEQLEKEIPFLLTETMLMELSKKGKDRQEMHSIIKKHSLDVINNIKQGKENDLFQRINNDDNIPLTKIELDILSDHNSLSGLALKQTEDFLKDVKKILEKYEILKDKNEISV